MANVTKRQSVSRFQPSPVAQVRLAFEVRIQLDIKINGKKIRDVYMGTKIKISEKFLHFHSISHSKGFKSNC